LNICHLIFFVNNY